MCVVVVRNEEAAGGNSVQGFPIRRAPNLPNKGCVVHPLRRSRLSITRLQESQSVQRLEYVCYGTISVFLCFRNGEKVSPREEQMETYLLLTYSTADGRNAIQLAQVRCVALN